MERKYFKINRKNKVDSSDINENVMLDAISSAKSIIDGQIKEEIKNINSIDSQEFDKENSIIVSKNDKLSLLKRKKELLETFKEILGYSDTKPFECVGTLEEARYAISLVLDKGVEHSYLLEYYRKHYPLFLDGSEINKYNEENNIDDYFDKLVKEEMNKYV